ncbi:MAG: hypothetical protein KatS3mg022_2884 [Armatimonadota bacterium]|nr:MAG: hypothetical protein KatS3mg022_2884 [Armatimonadota bacterium]
MARASIMLAGVVLAAWAALILNGCGGGGGTAVLPSQYITLTNGKVVVEQGAGVVIIKANQSQLPGVGFDDVVEVKLYRGDGFVNPRTDTPAPADFLRTFRVSRDGTLLDDLQLPEGRYTAVAENIHVVQDGKEFRSALTAYVFDVFASGGSLHTTLPIKFEAKFPALGAVIENSYVAFLTDAAAAGGSSRLFVQHANGTVDMTRPFVAQTEGGNPVAAVSFDALPGGPTLGNVSRLILKALKP